MTDPRDWDKELADIDRLIAKEPAAALPAKPGAASAPAPGAPPRPPAPPARGGTATWLRVLLVLALALAMPFYPYPHACGLGLALYLAAAGFVVVAGGWGALSSWQRRLGRAHVLSLLSLLWGLGLLAAEILPRIGYAAARLPWRCG